MSDKLNRLARVKGNEAWMGYGNVCHIEAARRHAEFLTRDRAFMFVASVEKRDEFEIEVRCLTDDATCKPHCFKMKRRVVWDCLNPRQGADDPKPVVKPSGEPRKFNCRPVNTKVTLTVPDTIDEAVRDVLERKTNTSVVINLPNAIFVDDPGCQATTEESLDYARDVQRIRDMQKHMADSSFTRCDGSKPVASIRIQQQVGPSDLAEKHIEQKRMPSKPQVFPRMPDPIWPETTGVHPEGSYKPSGGWDTSGPNASESIDQYVVCDVGNYRDWPSSTWDWKYELEYQEPISGGYPKTTDKLVRREYEESANVLLNGLRNLIWFWVKSIHDMDRDERKVIVERYYTLVKLMHTNHPHLAWSDIVAYIAKNAKTGRKQSPTGALSLWLFWQCEFYKPKLPEVSVKLETNADEVADIIVNKVNNLRQEDRDYANDLIETKLRTELDNIDMQRKEESNDPNGPGIAKVQVQLPQKVPLRTKSDYVNVSYHGVSMTVPKDRIFIRNNCGQSVSLADLMK
jgi:hypothetical protein